MKSIKLAPSLLFIVAILMTSCATVPEETRKVNGITIKPGYPVPNDAATLKPNSWPFWLMTVDNFLQPESEH